MPVMIIQDYNGHRITMLTCHPTKVNLTQGFIKSESASRNTSRPNCHLLSRIQYWLGTGFDTLKICLDQRRFENPLLELRTAKILGFKLRKVGCMDAEINNILQSINPEIVLNFSIQEVSRENLSSLPKPRTSAVTANLFEFFFIDIYHTLTSMSLSVQPWKCGSRDFQSYYLLYQNFTTCQASLPLCCIYLKRDFE